jgi:hypothetical protein
MRLDWELRLLSTRRERAAGGMVESIDNDEWWRGGTDLSRAAYRTYPREVVVSVKLFQEEVWEWGQ